MPKAILEFSGEYRWLSNFWPSVVEIYGVRYPTVENAYQAAKTLSVEARKQFETYSPADAKLNGRLLALRPGWIAMRESIMLRLLKQKFQDVTLQECLLASYPRRLVEGNRWNDTYWGICNGKGQNRLGVLLMLVRDGLRVEASRRTRP